jgi:hypothetical protein
MWEIEYTDEFGDWWSILDIPVKEDIEEIVNMLKDREPNLQFPHSSGVTGSIYPHMRELRIQHKGEPYRIFYAFDPRRCAILLIGGNKTGKDRWYKKFIPIADKLYKEHLETLKREGLYHG